jgi:hypothetical protein
MILVMMVVMTGFAIYWWKKYGKLLFGTLKKMNSGLDLNSFSDIIKGMNDFKIPNQWKK